MGGDIANLVHRRGVHLLWKNSLPLLDRHSEHTKRLKIVKMISKNISGDTNFDKNGFVHLGNPGNISYFMYMMKAENFC